MPSCWFDKLASGQVKARLQAREGLIESMNQFICARGSKFGRSPCSLKLIPAGDPSLEPAAYFSARKLNGADYNIIRQHQMGRNGRHIQPGVFRYLFLNRLEREKIARVVGLRILCTHFNVGFLPFKYCHSSIIANCTSVS